MERQIGEIFTLKGVKLKVVESKENDCTGCYFFDERTACSFPWVRNAIGFCNPFFRKDMTYVIFKRIK